MNKKVISLLLCPLLCLGLILGNAGGAYADETRAPVSQEETIEIVDYGSTEAEIVPASDHSDDANAGDDSLFSSPESPDQHEMNDIEQPGRQTANTEEDINLAEDENSEEAPVEDTVDSFGIAILKSEGGFLQYADSMNLPDEEESSDENIQDLRHIAPGTEIYIRAIPERQDLTESKSRPIFQASTGITSCPVQTGPVK